MHSSGTRRPAQTNPVRAAALLLTICIAGAASLARAEPLDRMRAHLGTLQLDLSRMGSLLSGLSAVDFGAARQAGMIGDPLTDWPGVPGMVYGGSAGDGFLAALAASDLDLKPALGIAFARIEALAGFGSGPDAATTYVLADATSAALMLDHLARAHAGVANPDGTITIGTLGQLDLAHSDPRDPIRGQFGLGAVLRQTDARLEVRYSPLTATAPAAPDMPLLLRALLTPGHDGLLAGLDRVIPQDALVVQLIMQTVTQGPDTAILDAMMGGASPTDLRALVAETDADAMPPFLGLALALWSTGPGANGTAMAFGYLSDCDSAGAARDIVARRWTAEPLFDGQGTSAEAAFGPLLATFAGAGLPDRPFCAMAFATTPDPRDPGAAAELTSRLFYDVGMGMVPLLR